MSTVTISTTTEQSFSSFSDSQTFPSSTRSICTSDSLKKSHGISLVVQSFLTQVYLFLFRLVVAFAVGAYLDLLWNFGGFTTGFATSGCMFWLVTTPPHEVKKRALILMAGSFFHGTSLDPLMDLAKDFDSSMLVSALLETTIIFACISAVAIFARRKEFLYLNDHLFSGLKILLGLKLASSIFPRSEILTQLELYFGVLVLLVYVLVDTQEMIERAHHGDLDCVRPAVIFFAYIIAVFVRIRNITCMDSA